jgi:hypothetical protein
VAEAVRKRSPSSGQSARTAWLLWWPSRSAVDDPPDTRDKSRARGRLPLRPLEQEAAGVSGGRLVAVPVVRREEIFGAVDDAAQPANTSVSAAPTPTLTPTLQLISLASPPCPPSRLPLCVGAGAQVHCRSDVSRLVGSTDDAPAGESACAAPAEQQCWFRLGVGCSFTAGTECVVATDVRITRLVSASVVLIDGFVGVVESRGTGGCDPLIAGQMCERR